MSARCPCSPSLGCPTRLVPYRPNHNTDPPTYPHPQLTHATIGTRCASTFAFSLDIHRPTVLDQTANYSYGLRLAAIYSMATTAPSLVSPTPNNDTRLPTPDTDDNENTPIPAVDHNSTPDHANSATMTTTEYYSFTPRGLPRGPRAWERHPAIQRAPRAATAGSKPPKIIWKRRPLNNITREINSKWKRGREEGGEDDGVVRPNKRARLVESDGEDKENADSCDGQAQGESEPELTLLKSIGYVPLTWGAERVEALLNGTDAALNEEDLHDEVVGKDEGFSTISDAQASPEGDAAIVPFEEPPESQTERSHSAIDIPVVEVADDSHQTPTTNSMEPCLEMCFEITPGIHDGQDANNHTRSDNAVEADRESSASKREAVDSSSPEEGSPRSDEACALSGTNSEITDIQPEGDSAGSAVQQPPISAPAEEDDTAYLQQFLQRAKEARAKSQNTQLYRPVGDRIKHHLIEQHNQTLYSAAIVPDRKRPHSPEPEDISNIEDQEEPTVTSTLLIPNPDEESSSLKPSSPSRRSSRLSNSSATKLPRPQQRPGSLPSNISLRRLNGTEFISMARQRSEAQSAAMNTRNNTRKNKGSALAVQQRLAQLQMGFADDGKGQAATTSAEEDQGPKKKRKKRAVGGGSVTWAEQIARFQGDDGLEHPYVDEPEPQADEAAVSTTTGDESIEPQQPPEEGGSRSSSFSSTPRKSRRSSSSTSTPAGKSRPANKGAASSSTSTSSTSNQNPNQSAESNVKHKRKESTGTVNGTPSVKRSVEKVLDEAREGGAEGAEEGRDAKRLRRRNRSEDAVA
jgi:hypothetical protein